MNGCSECSHSSHQGLKPPLSVAMALASRYHKGALAERTSPLIFLNFVQGRLPMISIVLCPAASYVHSCFLAYLLYSRYTSSFKGSSLVFAPLLVSSSRTQDAGLLRRDPNTTTPLITGKPSNLHRIAQQGCMEEQRNIRTAERT